MASSSVHETREAILRSALEVFAHKGYAGATIGAIAKKAKVNNLTVFRHFQGKENLFREVMEAHSDIILDTEELDRLVDGKTVLDGLSIISGYFFERMFRNIHIFRIFIIDSRHFDWVREMSWRMPPQFTAYLRDYLAELLPDTRDRTERLRLLADMFLSHITRLTLQFNKHDSIWEYSDDLFNAFNLKMKPQIEFFANVMLGKNTGNRVSVRLKPVTGSTRRKPRQVSAGERSR